jgi:hypothetical protein
VISKLALLERYVDPVSFLYLRISLCFFCLFRHLSLVFYLFDK